jgi:hypothetical protein
MKLITIGDSFVLSEHRRDVERNSDRMFVSYGLALKYGVAMTKELSQIVRPYMFGFEAALDPVRWKKYKDYSRDQLTQDVYNELKLVIEAVYSQDDVKIAATLNTDLNFSGLTTSLAYFMFHTPLLKDLKLDLNEIEG